MHKFKKTGLMLLSLLLLGGCNVNKSKNKAGDLVIYSPNSQGIMNAVIPLFEEKTGINVEVVSGGTGFLMEKIENEKNNPQADVLFGGTYTQFTTNKHLFQDYVSEENEFILDEYKNADGYLTFTVLDGSVIIVNKALTSDIKIEGYADLLNEKLLGKIATADPQTSSSAFSQLTNMLLAMSDDGTYTSEASWHYVSNLTELLDGKIQSGSSSVYKSVVDGEMWVGLTYEDPVATLIKSGAKHIDIVYPKEGTVFLPAGSAVVKDAKNLANAHKFIDFILSEEMQNIFGTTLTNRPVRKGAVVGDHMRPIEEIKVIFEDMDYVHEHKQDIIFEYMQIME